MKFIGARLGRQRSKRVNSSAIAEFYKCSVRSKMLEKIRLFGEWIKIQTSLQSECLGAEKWRQASAEDQLLECFLLVVRVWNFKCIAQSALIDFGCKTVDFFNCKADLRACVVLRRTKQAEIWLNMRGKVAGWSAIKMAMMSICDSPPYSLTFIYICAHNQCRFHSLCVTRSENIAHNN
jgi:hypothetical protein